MEKLPPAKKTVRKSINGKSTSTAKTKASATEKKQGTNVERETKSTEDSKQSA